MITSSFYFNGNKAFAQNNVKNNSDAFFKSETIFGKCVKILKFVYMYI
jgi:hypothetical protein